MEQPSILNIGLVGGGALCTEILEKTTSVYTQDEIDAPIIAVADTDPSSPGIVLAQQRGLQIFMDYHDLYDPQHHIDLIIILTPDETIFRDILQTRPYRIRILSYHVFRIFWQAIGREERKLRERTREMETLVNGITDFILVINPDMFITDVNESFLQKMGYTRDQVIGRKCYDVYFGLEHPCEGRPEICPLREAVQNKQEVRRIQKRLLPDGETRFYEVSIHPIWEKRGKIAKFIHISRDITRQRREDEEITRRLEQMVEDRTRQLKETHEKLLHQDKMSSLGKLSASVVHEINNPISGILNLTMLMKRIMSEQALNSKDIEQFKLYLNLMETETRRTSRIVSNLLAFSRQSKMEMKRVDINRLIEQTLLINANLLMIAGVKIEKHLSPDLPDLLGSEDQLLQVFMNLVSNATHAMESRDNGLLSIKTSYSSKQNVILIQIEDTGVGIPEKDMSRLFEPFFTTKKGKGVGLGLSVAYGIIQEHGGSIYVQSKTGEGTTFQVKLPVRSSIDEASREGGQRELR